MAEKDPECPSAAEVEAFRAQLLGKLIEPASPSFDTTRTVWNATIDRRPALIAQCRNAADVAPLGNDLFVDLEIWRSHAARAG